MTLPHWALLGFAVWTVLLLLGTVGIYRWSRILTGRAPIRSFRADRIEGADWYRRSMRAHANCIENLPVFGALVVVLSAAGIRSTAVNVLCLAVLAARILQSVVHVGFPETDRTVALRFAFFFVQIVAFLALAGIVAAGAH